MSEQAERNTADIMEAWREWLTQTERQFNAFFNDAMNSEPFARSMGSYMEMTAALQRMTAEGMQRYLTFLNMPSRADVVGLGETLRMIEDRLAETTDGDVAEKLRSIEARLARIEETLLMAVADVDASEERPEERAAERIEPFRTRRPPGFERVEEARTEVGAIPEGLRR